jgi:hypothetical protein
MEIHALQVYTNAAYILFRKHVDKSTRFHVRVTGDPLVFLVVHDKAKQWAPDVKVRRGRPRINRYRPRTDMIKEKMKSGKKAAKKKGKMKNCTTCGLDDHKTSECFTKSADNTCTGL